MRALVLIGLALLAACVSQPQTNRDLDRLSRNYQRQQAEQSQTGQASRPANDTCRMSEHADLIGKAPSEFEPPANARVVCHNCPMTMDFNATRLTIQLGPDGKVASMQCG